MLDHIPDDNLRDRLRNYNEEPAPDLWKKIAQEVRPADSSISERLRYYEESPTDEVWEAVNHTLKLQRLTDIIFKVGQTVAISALLLLLVPGFLKTSTAPMNEQESVYQNDLKDQKSGKDVETRSPASPPASSFSVQNNEVNDNAGIETRAQKHDENTALPEKTSAGMQADAGDSGQKSNSRVPMFVESRQDSGRDEVTNTAVIARPAGIAQRNLEQFSADQPVQIDSATVVQSDSVFAAESVVTVGSEKEKSEKKNRRPARIYLLAMPTFGYQEIKPLANDDIFIEGIEKISAFSTRRLGVRVEVGAEKELSDRFSVNAGLFYLQRKQTISYRYTDSENFEVVSRSEDSLVYEIEQPVMSSTFEYQLKNVGVVAGINYSLKHNRIGHRIGLGVEIHKPFSSSIEAGSDDAKLYLFGNAYYRVSYKISDRFDAIVQPTFNYAMQVDQRINAPFYVKPYGLGLNFGLYYYLR